MNIDNTLQERGRRYGSFVGHALVTQNIKRAISQGRNWESLKDDQKEALEMIAHKIGRIVNGDPDYTDSWHDIVGYARLVAERLQSMDDKKTEHLRKVIKKTYFGFAIDYPGPTRWIATDKNKAVHAFRDEPIPMLDKGTWEGDVICHVCDLEALEIDWLETKVEITI